jgi:tetratricopeptide (TPR) repeat protein
MEYWCEQCQAVVQTATKRQSSSLFSEFVCTVCGGPVTARTALVDPFARKHAEDLLIEAATWELFGDLERALSRCSLAIAVDPDYSEAYLRRAWVCLRFPNYQQYLDQVIEDCTRALELDPSKVDAYNNRGRAYSRQGNLENACLDYAKTLQLDPFYAIGALNTMSAKIQLDKYTDVIETYEAWRRDLADCGEKLVGSFLVCLALALGGKPYEEYAVALRDLKIGGRWASEFMVEVDSVVWNNKELYGYIDRLEEQNYSPERIAGVRKIQRLFESHFQ